ncbi:hypothetical protein [Gordonia alkaliphila]|uniref:Transcriptional regulator n=1 Tax=Gordonia alkaliphila TaxID=1053547 RepID=A0ABP8ZH04_9ACTN
MTDQGQTVTVTKRDLMSAAEVAARMSPADKPGLVTAQFVQRRMSSGVWPSTLLGRTRVMTEAQYWEALAIAGAPPKPRPSGLSPRSRHRPKHTP